MIALTRAKAFYEAVSPYANGKNLVEFCAGDGKGGAQFGETGLEKIIFVDVKEVSKFKLNTASLKIPFECHWSGMDSLEVPSDSFVIALHACGILTDKVIEKSIAAAAGFAVMPCCYNSNMKKHYLRSPPDKRKLNYSSEKNYYDAFRLQYIKEQGYHALLRRIDKRITPMNNVLIGIPQRF